MTVNYRLMRQGDIEPTAKLLSYVWQDLYSPFIPQEFTQDRYSLAACIAKQTEVFEGSQQNPGRARTVIAEDRDSGDFLGMCVMAAYAKDHVSQSPFDLAGFDAEVARLYVQPNVRGGGIGVGFLKSLAPWCADIGARSCYVWSFDDNQHSRFYTKHGATAFKTISYDYVGTMRNITAYQWPDFVEQFGSSRKV